MIRTFSTITLGVVLGAAGIVLAGRPEPAGPRPEGPAAAAETSDDDAAKAAADKAKAAAKSNPKLGEPAPLKPRLDFISLAPEAVEAQKGVEAYLAKCGLERSLINLVKIRASQINGCAMCLDSHAREARAQGETEQRIYLLNAWRDAPLYTDRERAALAWTEAVTNIANDVSDELFEATRRHFSAKELVDLTWAVASINAWNRLNRPFRNVPAPAIERPSGPPADSN